LTTLKGGPIFVSNNYFCNKNNLTNLEGFPEKLGGSCNISDNDIYDLKGYNVKKFIRVYENPIYNIFPTFEPEELDWFRTFKPIEGNKINLKRFKYVMSSLGQEYDLEKLNKIYTIDD